MKMIRSLTIALLFILIVGCNDHQQLHSNRKDAITVGIIIPIAHPAMDEITQGFEKTLAENLSRPVHFHVMNAQGDINLQRAMINQLHSKHVDLLAPISTLTTEMTAALVTDTPIVGLAAMLPEATRKHSQLALVNDEITPKQIIQFIHDVYPNKKRFAIVYANNDKIIPQVNAANLAAKELGITLTKRMISTLPDLYSVASTLNKNIDGIIVLKDVLVISGIATLANIANTQHIPLITADDGSVQNGAGFAIGVREYQIGVEGAHVAAKILNDNVNPSTLPVVQMTQLSVFINKKALLQQHQDVKSIIQQAHHHNYKIVDIATLPHEKK